MRAAGRSAPPTTAVATAATGRWSRRTSSRSAHGGSASARARTSSCASTGVSTPIWSPSRRPATSMSATPDGDQVRTIGTDYLARVEGEGSLYIRVRDGEVVDAKLKIFEPPRFFEAFLRGRS